MQTTTMRASLCALFGILLPLVANADAESARNKGAAWLIQQQRGDGSWANSNGELSVQASATALMALKNAGLAKAPTFSSAAAWLANADADSVDSIARKVEALAAVGMPNTAQTEADRMYLLRAYNAVATWGGYGGVTGDNVDTALGLTALRVGDANYSTKLTTSVFSAFCYLSAYRVPISAGKQAWASNLAFSGFTAGQGKPSVLATALLLGEMKNLQTAASGVFSSCTLGANSYNFTTVQAEAQAWLLDQQNVDGGFGEQRNNGTKGNSSVLVSALVYKALSKQAVPPQPQTTNTLNWLLAQQNATTGSWRGDPLVTASVLMTLPAAAGAQLTDTDGDGITNVVETQLGSNPNVADARGQLGSPTLSAPGVTATSFTVNATVGQAFAYSLGSGSAFGIASGSLPLGLTLNAPTGQITGVPTRVGTYSFEYQATVSGATQIVVGRIDVTDAALGDSDAPLPLWALLLLGSAVFGIGARRRSKAG